MAHGAQADGRRADGSGRTAAGGRRAEHASQQQDGSKQYFETRPKHVGNVFKCIGDVFVFKFAL